MNNENITKALILLFKAKNKIINDDIKPIIQTWIMLLDKYKLPDTAILAGIEKLIITKTQYGFEFADLYNLIKNVDTRSLNEKFETQWKAILQKCRGDKSEIDPLAEKCFLMITDFDKYGYSENDYEKSNWRKRWEDLYQAKLETGNYKDIQIPENLKNILKLKG